MDTLIWLSIYLSTSYLQILLYYYRPFSSPLYKKLFIWYIRLFVFIIFYFSSDWSLTMNCCGCEVTEEKLFEVKLWNSWRWLRRTPQCKTLLFLIFIYNIKEISLTKGLLAIEKFAFDLHGCKLFILTVYRYYNNKLGMNV